MKFSDFILTESAPSKAAQEIHNFQLANDSEVSSISITKDKLSVRYFQRHRKTAQDDKAFKELATKVFGKKCKIEYGDFENTAIRESVNIFALSKFADKIVTTLDSSKIFSEIDFLSAVEKACKKHGGDKILKTAQDYEHFKHCVVAAYSRKFGIDASQGAGLFDL